MANSTLTAGRVVSVPIVKRTKQRLRIRDYVVLLLLFLLLIIMLFPIVVVSMNSFKTEDEYYASGPLSLPQTLNLTAIEATWTSTDFGKKLFNSTAISLCTAVL